MTLFIRTSGETVRMSKRVFNGGIFPCKKSLTVYHAFVLIFVRLYILLDKSVKAWFFQTFDRHCMLLKGSNMVVLLVLNLMIIIIIV